MKKKRRGKLFAFACLFLGTVAFVSFLSFFLSFYPVPTDRATLEKARKVMAARQSVLHTPPIGTDIRIAENGDATQKHEMIRIQPITERQHVIIEYLGPINKKPEK